MKKIIVGAGAAGLGAWCKNCDSIIYEKEFHAGGLCWSFKVNGFVFDMAVHLSFSKLSYVVNLFKFTDAHKITPNPECWYYDRWIWHPIQNNLFAFEPDKKVRFIEDFINKPEIAHDNFQDYAIAKYGKSIYTEIIKSYNEKYWRINLEELGVDWIGDRLSKPSLKELLYGAFTARDTDKYYIKSMLYPNWGGTILFFDIS